MARFTKFNSQVPDTVRERFMQEEHGHKQLACTSGLIWYFNADEETKRLYRAWAQAVAEGYATIEEPPEMVKAALEKRTLEPPPRRRKVRR
jgi:hypothetical protein